MLWLFNFALLSLTLYLDGEVLEAELMEDEGKVIFHHLLIFLESFFV